MLQDFVQVDLLGAGVRKWCAPPFVHAPPPRPVVPRPRSHTLPLSPHLGAHRIPQPHFRTPPPLARSTLRPGCASPCSHTLRASAVCFPGCTTHRSVPLPFARGPLACPPLRGPPIARTPVPPALPVCAQEGWRACGRGGARGRGAARVEGTAHAREGGRHRPLCLPGMCAKGEAGGRGEARRKPGGGDGEARAEGRTEGGGAHCPSCPSPHIRTKGGGARACAAGGA